MTFLRFLSIPLIFTAACTTIAPPAPETTDETPATLLIDFTWLAFEPGDLTGHASFKQEMRVTREAVLDAVAKEKGSVMGSQKLHSQSGVNAIVEMVDEILYPTEFDVTENDIEIQLSRTNEDKPTSPRVIIPGGFETREVGSIVNVTPHMLEDGSIVLYLLIETAGLKEWEDFGSHVTQPDGSIQKSEMRQPIFSSQNITSRMEVIPGEPTIAFAGLNPKKGKIEVLVISARE